jgi:hypothetical protein
MTGRSTVPVIDDTTQILGLHRILPLAYQQHDMSSISGDRIARLAANPADATALMDLSMMLQSHGQAEEALRLLDAAVSIQRDFCVVHGDGSGVRLLAFVTPGDFMANTPVDFLLNGSNAVLWLHYVDGDTTEFDNLPAHDVALLAIGEANGHGPVLARMAELLPHFAGPIMNNRPDLIAALTRDGVSAMFANEPSILSPQTHRIDRTALLAITTGSAQLPEAIPGLDFPFIIRPIGTHAGGGLDRLLAIEDLFRYLEEQDGSEFYVAPFIDYRGADGLYNKQRIVLIHGRPFPSHMALSSHWIVHYLSAGMAENADKRAVEADWMAHFDRDFARRHADAFAALYRHVGLDYFGIDCAELPDGRLLVFELDVAMVVHDMDDVTIFPYKKIAMQTLFDAFVAGVHGMREPRPQHLGAGSEGPDLRETRFGADRVAPDRSARAECG